MQTNSGMTDLMPSLELITIDTNLHTNRFVVVQRIAFQAKGLLWLDCYGKIETLAVVAVFQNGHLMVDTGKEVGVYRNSGQ